MERTSGDDVLRLPGVGKDVLRRLARAPGHARQRDETQAALESLTQQQYDLVAGLIAGSGVFYSQPLASS